MAWPTTDDPRTEFITLRLTMSEAADVDWLIAQTGSKNRSDAVRSAVGRVISAEKRKKAKQRRSGTPGPGMKGADDD
jgi:Arc/MetJ-type ribon-helix-helix transcriptional regulator